EEDRADRADALRALAGGAFDLRPVARPRQVHVVALWAIRVRVGENLRLVERIVGIVEVRGDSQRQWAVLLEAAGAGRRAGERPADPGVGLRGDEYRRRARRDLAQRRRHVGVPL